MTFKSICPTCDHLIDGSVCLFCFTGCVAPKAEAVEPELAEIDLGRKTYRVLSVIRSDDTGRIPTYVMEDPDGKLCYLTVMGPNGAMVPSEVRYARPIG